MERSCKLLDFGTSHCALPTLCLNINDIEAEFILVDDAINAFVSASTYGAPGILATTSIAHLYEQVDNEALEERRGYLFHLLKQTQLQICAQLSVCIGKQVIGALSLSGGWSFLLLGFGTFPPLKLLELRISLKKLNVDVGRIFLEQFATFLCDAKISPARDFQKSGLLQIGFSLSYTIIKDGLVSTG